MRSARLLVGWDQRVELRTISIARLRRISHSSRSSSDGTNVGGVVGTDRDPAGCNDAGGAERTGSGSVGGNALSGLTNRDRSQARTKTRSTRRWAPSLCCPAPTASISILLRMQYSASHYAPAIVAHDTLKRCWSVVGTYGDLTKTYRCSSTARFICNIEIERH